MTSLYQEIMDFKNEFGSILEEIKGTSFSSYMSNYFDLNALFNNDDKDYKEERLQEMAIRLSEIRDEVKRSIEEADVMAEPSKTIPMIFYSSETTFSIDYDKPKEHKIIDVLCNRYSNYADVLNQIYVEMMDSTLSYGNDTFAVSPEDLFNTTHVAYSEPLSSMIIACLIFELNRSIPEDIALDVIEEAVGEYQDIYEVRSQIEDCRSFESLLLGLDASVLLYVLGDITSNNGKWPYGNAAETMQEKLKQYDMNKNKIKKAAIIGVTCIDAININTVAILSILRSIIEKTSKESDNQLANNGNTDFEFVAEQYPYKLTRNLDRSHMMRLNILAIAEVDTVTALQICKDVDKFKEWLSGSSNFGLLRGMVEELIEGYGDDLYKC